MLEIHLLDQLTHEVFGQGYRALEVLLEPLRTLRRYQRVGVVARRQEHELELAPIARERQRILERAPGSLKACAVTVEAKDELAREAKNLVQVLLGGGGAERRYRVSDAGLMQAHHVHVAFDDEQPLEVRARLSRLVDAIELAAFVKQRRFGRVQVLGLALVDDAATEAQHPAARVADRENQAVAKPVVKTRRLPGTRVALDDEARLQQATPLLVRGAEPVEQGVPRVRGITQRELCARGRIDAALAEIDLRALAVLGVLLEEP